MTRKPPAPIQAGKVIALIGVLAFLTAHVAFAQQKASTPLLFLFNPLEIYSSAGNAVSIAMGDVNGDGKPDLVIGNCSPDPSCYEKGSVSVLLGNGDGSFRSPMVYDAGGYGTNSVALADMNGDGKVDLVVANCGSGFNCSGFGVIGVLLGNGDGTFRAAMTYGSGDFGARSITIADVNGDGKADLVIANGSVSVLLGNGDGSFQSPVLYRVISYSDAFAWSVAVADVTGDGKPDLVAGGRCGSTLNCGDLVAVLLGNGDGTFQWWSPIAYDSHEALQSSVAVGDVNGDGKPDLVVANLYYDTVGVLLGNGNGTFQPVVTYDCRFWAAPPNGGASSVVLGDVNGDGKPDLLVESAGVALLLNNGDGTFQPVVTYDASYPGQIALGDLNQDGKPDVAVVQTGGAGVLLNNLGAPPTTISLAASVNPVTLYQSVTYTAKVTPTSGGTVNGTVTFMDGAYKVGELRLEDNKAALKETYTYVNTHPITAVYSGELNNAAGRISKTLIESVQINSTSTALVSNLNPSIYGQAVTFTATVTGRGSTPPTGKVLFQWRSSTQTYTIGSAMLNSSGVATFIKRNLNADPYPMFAVYSGDAYNLGSSSAVWNQIVTQTTSAATITSSLNPSTKGQPVSFTTKIASPTVVPTGPVIFKAGTTELGTAQLSSGKAIFTTSTLPAGSTVVKVIYNGDSNIKAGSAAVTQMVQP